MSELSGTGQQISENRENGNFTTRLREYFTFSYFVPFEIQSNIPLRSASKY